MDAITDINQLEVGRRLAQVREAAGIKQVDLARKITWSPAVLSRVESGERQLSSDELEIIAEAIGTAEAMDLSKVLGRDWREIQRPPLDHPDQDILWEAEQICRKLVELRNHPEVRHAFERRLTEYIDDIKRTASLLLKREHEIAVIGSKGIGKSTAICKVTGLEIPNPDGGAPTPVLEAGGGGVTICDVHLQSGQAYGLLVEPCSDDEMRAHVTDFAEHVMGMGNYDEDENSEDEGRGIAQEVERAIRNLASLKVRRDKGPDGKTLRRDEAKDLAAKTTSIREFVVDVLALMELHRRDRRDIWYDPSSGKPPLSWLKDTFEQVNNGRHPDFTLPNRIEIIVPRSLLGTNDLSVRFVDTRGIDRTAARADVERHLDEPHTLSLLCSSFNDAPSATAHLLLERAKGAGVRRLELNAVLLVLPRANEALAVKDEAGVHADTIEEGYDLKAEFASMALESLGLQNIKIGFFNAFGDEPSRLRNLILQCLGKIRQSFRSRIEEAIASAQALLLNHEEEQVQEVLRSAARMMMTWVSQNGASPVLGGHVQDSLMSEIQTAYAATVRAAVRREGEWRNLSYSHHLGYGARRLAVLALDPLIAKFKTATELLEGNPEYAEAKDLIQQARRVLDSAFEELLRKSQIMGQTSFKSALKLDPSLWLNCENEWGQGPGYRDRVAHWNSEWFTAESRRYLERELWDVVVREWSAALQRLSSLLETDGRPA
ncbi:MAG: helix-turn-helix transcriptional regulator [Candidatus Binataceae bacterium]